MPPTVDSAALRRCGPGRLVMPLAGTALGTSWRVRLACRPEQAPAFLDAAITQRLATIVAQMSQWEPTSLLSRFNVAPAGTWFALPTDFATVMTAALAIAERSGGAFDPTHGRAAALLGYGAIRFAGPPSSADLERVRAEAGWQRLAFDPASRRLRQPGGLWLDLSGIAKGFAVDAIAELLREHGFDDALIEIGGELVGRGVKPDGQPWWVDIEDPPGTMLPPLRIALHDMAVATSGDYVRGAHTLDPRTGHSIERGVASVTVLHDSAMWADGWATALTVHGLRAGAALAEREHLAARIVVSGNDTLAETLSPVLASMIDE